MSAMPTEKRGLHRGAGRFKTVHDKLVHFPSRKFTGSRLPDQEIFFKKSRRVRGKLQYLLGLLATRDGRTVIEVRTFAAWGGPPFIVYPYGRLWTIEADDEKARSEARATLERIDLDSW